MKMNIVVFFIYWGRERCNQELIWWRTRRRIIVIVISITNIRGLTFHLLGLMWFLPKKVRYSLLKSVVNGICFCLTYFHASVMLHSLHNKSNLLLWNIECSIKIWTCERTLLDYLLTKVSSLEKQNQAFIANYIAHNYLESM